MKKLLILNLSFLFILSSCASNPNKIANQVQTIGKSGDIEVRNLLKNKDLISGKITAHFDFVATGDKPEQVFWRCEFYEVNGIMLGEPARFVEATIYPNQPVNLQCILPENAADFKINFQNIATNMTIYY